MSMTERCSIFVHGTILLLYLDPLFGPFASILATEILLYRRRPISPQNTGFSEISYSTISIP